VTPPATLPIHNTTLKREATVAIAAATHRATKAGRRGRAGAYGAAAWTLRGCLIQ
jgi:hypothetical protein